MRRRTFLEAAGSAVLGAGTVGCAAHRPARIGHLAPRHWAWVHGGGAVTPEQWRTRFVRLAGAGITGVLVTGGDTAALSAAARAAGLAFHRWIWVLNRSGDAAVKAEHPEWFTVSRAGASSLAHPPYVGYYQWLCPTRPEVRAYLRRVVAAVAAEPGVDGLHLDYIRHCDVILPRALWARYNLVQDRELPEYDFCYCSACRDAFRARTGRDVRTLRDPPGDADWRAFRGDGVTALVGGLAEAAHAAGKPISAAVFPTPRIARRLVRQAWDDWPLDAVFPMLYHRFYEEGLPWIGAGVREGVRALRGRAPLYAGLYLPDLPPDQLCLAIERAARSGAAGVAVFEAGSLTDAHLASFAARG